MTGKVPWGCGGMVDATGVNVDRKARIGSNAECSIAGFKSLPALKPKGEGVTE